MKTIDIFLDEPGGSGKTFLYSTLLSFIRGRGDIALPFPTTDKAATVLKGGRTIHSGFKLPVPLLDTSVSSMRPHLRTQINCVKQCTSLLMKLRCSQKTVFFVLTPICEI
ncbi:hypothetical protein AVEN_159297-1 [Araneus ventricosus]|uniref:ATP-dependent DNA helicase n=1 Tax=Araneus ventricosus TaxID=182803 RepID=A0A4Y2A0G5_ARAVE|nr:hypothetical protein AVEN_159297-1 [Araneus ventricosus]